MPTIRLDGLYPVDENVVHKVKGVLTRSIPEGYSLVQQDFLYAINDWYLDDSNCYCDDESSRVKVFITPFAQRDATLALNVKVPDDYTPVTICGYMILRNEDTGTLEYFYTHTLTACYGQLA